MTYRIRSLPIADLEFKRIPVNCLASNGNSFVKWKRVGMPKIKQDFIECVFYLYLDRESAEQGLSPKASGFLIEHEHHRM